MRHLLFVFCFFSWAIWRGFPVVSGPIKSAQTQAQIPRAYGPALDPRVCASGCGMHDCLHDAYRSFWKEAASKHSTTIWQGLTPYPGRCEAWEEEHCLSQGLLLGLSWWVSPSVGGFPGVNFTTLQAPEKHRLISSHHQGWLWAAA